MARWGGMSREKLEHSIKMAMITKAPSVYRELRDQGELEKVIRERADLVEEMYDESFRPILEKIDRMDFREKKFKDPIERVATHNMMDLEAWREALEYGWDFPEEEVSEEERDRIDKILMGELDEPI